MDNEKPIYAYKGFDKDLKCRGFQYEVGKDYEQDGNIKCCEKGFHACEFPLEVFCHYTPGENSRYCTVTQSGEMDKREDDSKVASSKIHIETEIGLGGIIKAGVKFILDKVNWKDKKASDTGNYSVAVNTGDYSAAANCGYYSVAVNTGDRSAATNTGNYSVAVNTGDYSAATNTGNYSVAANCGYYSVATNTGDRSVAANCGYYSVAANTGDQSVATDTGYRSVAANCGNYSVAVNTGDQSVATDTGYRSTAVNVGRLSTAKVSGKDSIAIVTGSNSKAAGALGDWIVLTERYDWKWDYQIKDIKAFKVDGEKIQPNTFYKLVNGEAVEA